VFVEHDAVNIQFRKQGADIGARLGDQVVGEKIPVPKNDA
jgi:hypothetical protein